MDLCELSPSYVRSIAPYQPGKPISELARELGLDEAGIVKLASNENPLGIGPRTRAAIDAALPEIARYPDGNGFELKQALSRRYGVDMSGIVLGNGSNDVLELVALAFLGPGRAAVMSQHAFAVYPLATQARGARSIVVPAKNYGHDLETMARAIDDETYVAWIANPNNPTGTLARPDELEAFLRKVPERVLVVIDEAYNEYIKPDLRADTVKWLKRHPNLVVVRTFSKAYGLAGLRVGYGFAHPSLADVMNRVRQPFNEFDLHFDRVARPDCVYRDDHAVVPVPPQHEPAISVLAILPSASELAAAAAALDDMEFVARSYALNLQGMAQLEEGARRLGLPFIPSYGNFVTIQVGKAPEIYKRLLRRSVIVRPVGGGYGLPEHLRVTIGTQAENEKFLGALAASLKE